MSEVFKHWPSDLPDPGFETALTPAEAADPAWVEYFGVEPNQARSILVGMGYTPEMWDDILEQRGASHSIRASIIIATGDQKRSEAIVRDNIRLQDKQLGFLAE